MPSLFCNAVPIIVVNNKSVIMKTEKDTFLLALMLTEAYADDLQISVKTHGHMGDGERVGTEIHSIKIVDKIEVLGVIIDKRLENINDNWEKAIRKMVNKANYWNLFRLSIGGRAMIAKTYLITQLTYLIGSIPAEKDTLDRANEIIINFVNGRERKIAAERLFVQRENGGYRVTDMNVLNMHIKASWIRRWCALEQNDDYAEMRCLKGNKLDPDHINKEEINKEGFLCSGEII